MGEFVRRFEKPIRIAVWRVAQRYGKNNGSLIQDLAYVRLTTSFYRPLDPDAYLQRKSAAHSCPGFQIGTGATLTRVAASECPKGWRRFLCQLLDVVFDYRAWE
jgi:hypothetical protein